MHLCHGIKHCSSKLKLQHVFLNSMYRFLECKPNVIKGTVLNSKTRTWVANLLDGRLPENRQAIGFLQAEIICSTEGVRGCMRNLEKLLLVTCASQTQVFITLFEPQPIQFVKRMLEMMFKRFGEHVLLRALGSVHMMNYRDECTIQAWYMAGDFEEEEDQSCTNIPSRKEDLHLCQGTVVKYSGAQGCARAESQLSTFTNSIGELENQWTALSEEREYELAQRIKECKDPEEKEWIEAAFVTESVIPAQMHNVRMALNDLKMRHEDMQNRLNLCMTVIIDFRPEAMLYKVDFMSESEREELIKDSLSLRVKQYAEAFIRICHDPNMQVEANNLKDKTEYEVVKTHYDLMQQGVLPNFEKDHRLKVGFISRTMNVSKHLLDGQASDKRAYKDKVDQLQTCSNLKCTTCKKTCAPRYYRVLETGICYPIASLPSEPARRESILVFCSLRCQHKWDEVLMCPKCKSFDLTYDVKGAAPYPCPFKLIDNLTQYSFCRRQLENIPVCPITRTVPRMICLPLCTSCNGTMMPRTPSAPHLSLAWSYDDLRPV